MRFDYKERVAGFTDILELDASFIGPGRMVSLGPDMKERWRITGLNSPTDARVAPDGHVFIVESNDSRVTERTTANRLINSQSVNNQPVNIELLPGGGKLVVCRNNVFTFDKAGKQVWHYQRNTYDILTGHLLPNGDTLIVTNTGQPKATAIRLDGKLKPTGKTYLFGYIYNQQSMGVAGDHQVLVCEANQVAEYDLKTGKQVWKHDCTNASSCQRLINGNTLICLLNQGPRGKVIEVDPSGEIVWEYEGKDNLRPVESIGAEGRPASMGPRSGRSSRASAGCAALDRVDTAVEVRDGSRGEPVVPNDLRDRRRDVHGRLDRDSADVRTIEAKRIGMDRQHKIIPRREDGFARYNRPHSRSLAVILESPVPRIPDR